MSHNDLTSQELGNLLVSFAEDTYKAAIFESLMHYQLIEDTLRSCIVTSYEILDITSHQCVTFCPEPNHIKDLRKNKGLGSLVNIFRTLTPHKDFCDRLSAEVEKRNKIAHQAAGEFAKFPLCYETSEELQMKATDISEAAMVASWLYDELLEIQQHLLKVHAEVREIHETLFEHDGPNQTETADLESANINRQVPTTPLDTDRG